MGKVFLQRVNGQLQSQEARIIYQHCIVENIKTQFFEYESLADSQINLAECELIVGSVEAVCCGFQLLSIPIPAPNYYPEELSEFLHRSVWKGLQEDVVKSVIAGKPVFAKPFRWKLFTGRVFHSSAKVDMIFDGLPKNEQLWLGDPVTWLSEYRVYVINNCIEACCIYAGNENIIPDFKVIERAISILGASNPPAAYAIDWGVLLEGSTALVEMGDGFSMGAYKGIYPKQYFRFLKTRWDQLSNKLN